MSYKHVKETVEEFQTDNVVKKEHIKDLQKTSLYLHNDLCKHVRKGSTGGFFFVDKITSVSDFIEG